MPTKKTGTRRRRSPLQAAFSALQKAKAAYCNGKLTQVGVKAKAKAYVAKAVAAGQTTTEATAKASRVLKKGCSMSSSIAAKKRKPVTASAAVAAKPRRRKATTTAKKRTPARRKRYAA